MPRQSFRPSSATRRLIDPPNFLTFTTPLPKQERERMRNLARRIRGIDPLPPIQE
jgi:hypothetical protein